MGLKAGIHLEPFRQFSQRLIRYEKILTHNGIEAMRLCSSHSDFWEQVKELDLFIYYWGQWDTERQIAKTILPIIENEIGTPCFPNQRMCWIFDDKIREYYLMKSNDYPIADSWVFWEEQPALEWAETTRLPVVFKLTGGAGSANVILIDDRGFLKKTIKGMFKKGVYSHGIQSSDSLAPGLFKRLKRHLALSKRSLLKQEIPYFLHCPNWIPHKHYALFQEFLPNNAYDTRVTVIGNRAFAFRRFNRDNDFRSSGSGKIDYDVSAIDLKFIEVAFEISKKFNFQTMAYDFLYGLDGQIKFCEMSYAYVDYAVFHCPGYWDNHFNWHEGNFWPQYFHLMDALNQPDLIQPDELL